MKNFSFTAYIMSHIKLCLYILTVRLIITTHPMNETVAVGNDVNFTCEASDGIPPISYRWLFNGVELMADPGHISGVNTTSLMITDVVASDGGTYSCEATDSNVGNVTSNEATLYSKCLVIMCV